jgi:hypothetical protein
MPVFLLTAFAKNERVDLAWTEIHELAKAVKAIVKSYGA